ncbi:flagellar export chaperone FliS [Salinibacterium sp. SYSU T00001]|uniref:flagellar export chaperone FliS n=1 Tax=Homoserinimonas sedimenticola TaxID=2986805 RepID=UPI002235971E|nr:flagellar export chaperone FliS [Salinibacterium sedimenticola]MCW4385740.1 flagellar export chaperone FliS [Salinibacterium sedimenticola]
MTMTGIDSRRAEYARDAILNASPARLLTMLYDRLILDLQRAEIAQDIEDWGSASQHLLHAQDIIAELTSSLKVDEWDGAEALMGVYAFASKALVFANINRDSDSTRLCLTLLEPLRQTWHEAAAQVPESAPVERTIGGTLGVA